ncbi:serine protease snake-like [Wyeomyia smithii]|uniref:serine protease snake-like n=1 Tax=Wyeomyia smithii TaxID=174621 RepID=UPI00246812C5|nr:serine protease snake-like [Wyeomyia smithii]
MKLATFAYCLLLLLTSSLAQGLRVSQINCSKYRNQTISRAAAIPLTLNPTPIIFETFNCSKSVSLIVGGEEAKEGEFPHHALLGWPKKAFPDQIDFNCGGSLISERFVLTAAHCMKYGRPTIVRLGEHDLRDEYGNQADIGIESIRRHPQHKFASSYHDIALIKLNQSIPFSALIRPACLWNDMKFNFTSAIASGFGKTDFLDNQPSDVLRKVQLDFLDKDECENQFIGARSFLEGIKDGQLCIGSKRGGRDTCQGDSGGPLQIITEPKSCIYYVIGVTSTGSGCGYGKSPSVYTSVASYLDWIEDIVWK